MKILWFVIVFICGALLPLQTGLNAKLGKAINSPFYSAFICFIVGALAMLFYVPFTKESINWADIKSTSVLSLIGGGFVGVLFIFGSMLALPRVGIAVTFGLIVAGQLIMSVLLDHYSILVTQQHSFNYWRFIGIVCILIGVAIVERF